MSLRLRALSAPLVARADVCVEQRRKPDCFLARDPSHAREALRRQRCDPAEVPGIRPAQDVVQAKAAQTAAVLFDSCGLFRDSLSEAS